MRFRYLRDPLFLTCALTYFVNRFVLKAIWETGFVHEGLNDLICIPFWVPVMLWAERRLGLRRHDGPPEAVEVVVPLVVWSWVFEVVLPRTELFGRYCVSDHRDVFYYVAGALGAAVFWRWWYGDGASGERTPPAAPGPVEPGCSAVKRVGAQDGQREETKNRGEKPGDHVNRLHPQEQSAHVRRSRGPVGPRRMHVRRGNEVDLHRRSGGVEDRRRAGRA